MTDAQRDEALDRPLVIEYDGHTYTIDRDEIEVDAFEHIERKNYVLALISLLGEQQWEAYKQRHPKAVDLEPFLEAVMAAMGNWSASPTS